MLSKEALAWELKLRGNATVFVGCGNGVDYCHDSTLIVSMPYYHHEREENGFLVSTARVEEGVIAVSHMPHNPSRAFNIRDTSDLKHVYAQYHARNSQR